MSHVGKPITCKAMVMWSKDSEQVEETIQVDPPKKGEVRIKVLGCGVCHTDWSEPRSFSAPVKPEGSDVEGFPVILGHEVGGIVESVGEGVTSVIPGDYVIPLYIAECRQCGNCTRGVGRTNLCTATDDTQYLGKLLDGTSRFSTIKDGKKVEILHFMGVSGFSEYTVVPDIAVAKISKKAPLEKVCLLGCGVTTGMGAVLNTAKVEAGSNCAVFGLGGVGLSVIMGLKMAGAKTIIGVDINPEKEAQAREFGMTHFVNPKEIAEGDTVEGTCWQLNNKVNDGAGGLDYTFECVGSTKLMRSAIECLHEGWGKCIIIGVAPSGAELSVKPLELVVGKSATGSAFGGCRGRTQLPVYVDQYLNGQPPFVDTFVSAVMPHTEVNHAFHLMHQGKTLRSVVTFPHEGDVEVAAHRAQFRQPKSAIIFLHGFGDKPSSWQETAEYLANKVGPNCKPVCPAAPFRNITKDDNKRNTGWFDVLKNWPRNPGDQNDQHGIDQSIDQIHRVIDDLVTIDKIPADRIIVAGFSQGGVMAVASTYTYKKRLGGCINLSGWVPIDSTRKFNEANANTAMFWGHGGKDEIVPHTNQDEGEKCLVNLKVPVTAHRYEDIGHDTNEDEFAAVLSFIKKHLNVE